MKKKRIKKAKNWGIAATTTSWDWGFKPVPCKGGKTTNCETSDSMFYREQKEMNKE